MSNLRSKFLLLSLLVLTQTSRLPAEVRLPAIISNHLVVQQNQPVVLWGWADPKEEVRVSLAGRQASTTADAAGTWKVALDGIPAGGPWQLEISGVNQITIHDVWAGEVWLCSGQSNMAMTVNRAANFEEEQAAADYPKIRQFKVTSGPVADAAADVRGEWEVCSPDSVARFSATGYFFARNLHQQLGVPVAIVNSSVGGTPIQSWIDKSTQLKAPQLQPFFAALGEKRKLDPEAVTAQFEKQLAKWTLEAKKAKAEGTPIPRKPRNPLEIAERKGDLGGLFNGMIAPLVQFRIAGALWYQGEANSLPDAAPFYEYQLSLLVRDWRQRWGYEFPFAWVQLPNFKGEGRDWPTVRQGMLNTLKLPKTGMAITLDIGETNDIHPRNKQDVGKRLAHWALANVYGRDVVASGPLPKSYRSIGEEIAIRFSHVAGGLVADGELKGFEVSNASGQWHAAAARLVGDEVVVGSKAVPSPVAVRYAWSNDPPCSLFNDAGFPATPFMTRLRGE